MSVEEAVRGKVRGCRDCHLRDGCKQPVPFSGSVGAKYLFLGEAPGAREDEEGVPFIGGAGKLLKDVVAKSGIHSRHVAYSNIVRCRPEGNRTPYPAEMEACRVNLELEIAAIGPKVMVLCGATPLSVFRPDMKVTHHRGTPFMVGDVVALPTFHPAFVLRQQWAEKYLRADVAQARVRVERGRFVGWPDTCMVCGDEMEIYDTMGVALCERHTHKADPKINSQLLLV